MGWEAMGDLIGSMAFLFLRSHRGESYGFFVLGRHRKKFRKGNKNGHFKKSEECIGGRIVGEENV